MIHPVPLSPCPQEKGGCPERRNDGIRHTPRLSCVSRWNSGKQRSLHAKHSSQQHVEKSHSSTEQKQQEQKFNGNPKWIDLWDNNRKDEITTPLQGKGK
ncbi:hypothetical protein CEXT_439221 [Caerostris extrusa]|uniref:Uncharacterized protein n=1 Tax=Caerostris extrusa TaxID=172846 RepID=A0AAV4N149_CAEEX|nr:hypothetical protein CEXT_439221 [Caerostris extrusa]